jgi:hypothetical protein
MEDRKEDLLKMKNNAINKTNDINEKISNRLTYVDPEKLTSIDEKLEQTKAEAHKDYSDGETTKEEYSLIKAERNLEAAKEKAQVLIDQIPSMCAEKEKESLRKDIAYANKLEEESFDYFTQDTSDVTSDTEVMGIGWDEGD